MSATNDRVEMTMVVQWEAESEVQKRPAGVQRARRRWQAKRRSNSHSQPPKAQHQSNVLISKKTLRHEANEIHSQWKQKGLFVRDFGFMYMTSISTYPKKKRSSTSTPFEGLVLPLASIMIFRVSNICSFGLQCLYPSLRKWKISSPPEPKPALSITNFTCPRKRWKEQKVSQSCSSREKSRRELENRLWRIEVKTLLLMWKKWKTEWYSQLLKKQQ